MCKSVEEVGVDDTVKEEFCVFSIDGDRVVPNNTSCIGWKVADEEVSYEGGCSAGICSRAGIFWKIIYKVNTRLDFFFE